jgi:hypothetical protein
MGLAGMATKHFLRSAPVPALPTTQRVTSIATTFIARCPRVGERGTLSAVSPAEMGAWAEPRAGGAAPTPI